MNALFEAPGARRLGLLPRARPKPVEALLRLKPVGDFERAAEAKGEDEDANASNPVRLVPVRDGISFGDVESAEEDATEEANPDVLPGLLAPPKAKGVGDGLFVRFEVRLEVDPLLVPANGDGDGVDLIPNTDGPLAVAKGDELDA